MGNISQQLTATGALKQKTNIKTSPYFTLTGGINVQDAPMDIPAGQLLGCQNYEPSIKGGYRRFDGYERFDGQTSPTDAPFTTVHFENIDDGPVNENNVLFFTGTGSIGLAQLKDSNGQLVTPSQLASVSSIFRQDWQGNQQLYSYARTNMSHAPSVWGANGGGAGVAPTITLNYTTDPAGESTATRIQCNLMGGNTTSDESWIIFSGATPLHVNVYHSVWIRSTDGVSSYTLYFRVGGKYMNVTVTPTWTRISQLLTAANNTADTTGALIGLRGAMGNSGSCDILVAFDMTEESTTLNAYIPPGTTTDYSLSGSTISWGIDPASGSLNTWSGVLNSFNPSVGSTLTESGSGATGVVAYVDAGNQNVVFVNVQGMFIGDGSYFTGGGVSNGAPYIGNAQTLALANAYWYEKWLYFQSFIEPVGGAACSGPVLGAWAYKAHVYAFRNSADGTQGTMWQSTTSGWVQIPLGYAVQYNNGIYSDGNMDPIPEGTVLTGAISGCTMTVLRVSTGPGTWGLDAAGSFVTNEITGTPVANENLQVGGVTYCTYLSSAPQTLPPGGTYYFRNFNFNDVQTPTTGFRMYGVNGVGQGFEYDDSGVFTLISTGMSPDVPTHLEIHASYLFYSFAGGSLQNSGYQLPLSWNPVFGADARIVGDEVTFLREDISQTLVIGTRRQIWTITGLQVEQFQIQVYATNTGAIAGTDEAPGQMIVGEDRGITMISATTQYGDFDSGSLTDQILKLIVAQFATDTVVGAITTRKKNMYRLLFASGAVYCLAINAEGSFTGWTTGTWVHTPSCISCGFTQQSGQPQIERAFFGSTNGYVYEIDKGRSFDGQIVDHFLKLNYWHAKSPSLYKRWRFVQLDMVPEGSASIFVGADCNYGNLSGMTSPIYSLGGGGGLWDIANWDEFIWDAPTYTGVQLKLELEGYNISLVLSGSAVNDVPFTASGGMYEYSPRIINRNTGT